MLIPRLPYIIGSYSEPKSILEALQAESSKVPERYGADFIWSAAPAGIPMGLAGVQRKQFPEDYIASIYDGRLAQEMIQIQQLSLRMLILEGRPCFSVDGYLLYDASRFTKKRISRTQILSNLWNVGFAHGVFVQWVEDQRTMIEAVRKFALYSNQENFSAFTRPAPRADWRSWILQGVPGIGPKTARVLLQHAPEPIQWTFDPMTIPGLHQAQRDELTLALKAIKYEEKE